VHGRIREFLDRPLVLDPVEALLLEELLLGDDRRVVLGLEMIVVIAAVAEREERHWRARGRVGLAARRLD
jgi:hypothetical protein